ncbi:MAG TPA: response regulator, partial [Burkholderiales bacterium]|nr:response regulator [Burkholderiales bacterium]
MNPVRILLVEDDVVDRMACRRALDGQSSFLLEEADAAGRGLQLVRSDAPNLILLDYHLPDMDGMEFLARLGTENPEIPVIMLTGAQDIAIAVESMRCGARDYLIKDAERDYLKVLPTVIGRVLRENQA